MATEDSSSGDIHPSAPLFRPFRDFPTELPHAPLPAHMLASFASSVRRIAGGCQVIVDLLQQELVDDVDRDDMDPYSPPRILGDFHRGQLQLMVSACMESLVHRATELGDQACSRSRETT